MGTEAGVFRASRGCCNSVFKGPITMTCILPRECSLRECVTHLHSFSNCAVMMCVQSVARRA